MSTPQQLAHDILQQAQRLNRLIPNVTNHIAHDQQDALATGGEPNNNPHNISDPTGNTATSRRLAPFAAKDRAIRQALTQVLDALDRTEHACAAALTVNPEHIIDPEPRCPGWNNELRTRLGGCGAVLERYKRTDRTEGTRSLCVGCRTAQYRAGKSDAA